MDQHHGSVARLFLAQRVNSLLRSNRVASRTNADIARSRHQVYEYAAWIGAQST
jgi:hypothetical protein